MALVLRDIDARPAGKIIGGQKTRIIQITGDNSYPTGGSALTAADCGLTTIVSMSIAPTAGRAFEYDVTNSKVKAFEDNGAAGALREVPNATNLSALVTRAFVVGT